MADIEPANDDPDGVLYLMDLYDVGYLGGTPADALVGAAASALGATDAITTRHSRGWTPVIYL